MATKADEYEGKVASLDEQFEKDLALMNSTEIVEDIVADVKTPP